MNLKYTLLVVLGMTMTACAAQTVSTNVSTDHPANPDAVSAANTPSPDVLDDGHAVVASSNAQATTTHDHHGHAHDEHVAHDDHDSKQAASDVAADLQQQIDKLATAYLKLSEMLAADKTEGAAALQMVIHHVGHDLSSSADAKIAELGEQIGKTAHGEPKTLDELRESFKAYTQSVIALVKRVPPSKQVAPVVREAYCPHIKKSWLQTGEKVANPYFGSAMLTCGKITGTIESRK